MPMQNSVARAAFASFMAQAVPGRATPYPGKFVEREFPQDRAARFILKGAVSPLTTDQAEALVQEAVADFLIGLAPLSAAARVMQRGMSISLRPGYDAVALPYLAGRAALAWVGENDPIPVINKLLSAAQVGPLKKFAGIAVFSRELADTASGQAIFERLLREDAANALDDAVFGTQSGTDDRAAGLLHGVTPLAAATGGFVGAMEADMIALAAAITTAGAQSVVFVTTPKLAASVMVRKPELAGMVWPAIGMPEGRVVAIDPGAFVFASGDVDIQASANAALHMDSAPGHLSTAGTPNTIAAPVRSMYQHDLIALRVILDISFAMRAAGMVAYIQGASW